MATLTDCKTGKTFDNLIEWLEWRDSVMEACTHEAELIHKEATTRRGTYHALECSECGKRVKYWRT
jgi:hypothetical protein